MDIVTHALIGSAAAAGVMQSQPELGCGIVLGNVIPDLDAFSRLAGKRAFLRFHQTYSHSVAAIAAPLLASIILFVAGSPIWSGFTAGLAIGMLMHIALDLTNSYGVRCAWPFSQRRFALDWIFFIDAIILSLTTIALMFVWWKRNSLSALQIISAGYVACLVSIVFARAMIARRARRIATKNCPKALQTTVIPTTWSPLKYLVCHDHGSTNTTLTLNAMSGDQYAEQTIQIFDSELPDSLLQLPEWKIMRGLSAHYHAVECSASSSDESSEAQTFVCRDLRIRNFNTRFGTLTCRLGADGRVISKQWDV